MLDWVWSFSERPRTQDEIAAQRAAKLDRMCALLQAVGHPERRFPSMLVAGTKGKGSTVAMVSACVQAAGLHAGRYTSPHLVNWRERTCIDAEPISTEAVIALAGPIREAVAQLSPGLGLPTTFEVGTAFALLHFARRRVDLAVLEVGTGGRFDATNVVDPLVSVITTISYDHTATLGTTLESIAWHKAGILRSGRPAITAPQPDEARLVIEREAHSVGAHLEQVGREWRWSPLTRGAIRVESTWVDFGALDTEVGLLGDHQRDNATTAVAALHALGAFRIPPGAVQEGLRTVDWPGRLQVLSDRPLIVVDGAHNGASAEAIARALQRDFRYQRLILVLGLSEGKDAHGVVDTLAPYADKIFLTRSKHERAALPTALQPLVRAAAPGAEIYTRDDASSAFDAAAAAAGGEDLVLITGSLFLVGEALVWWRRSPR